MLVGEMGVAANGGNRDSVKAGARRRAGLKAPIRVPVFGEDRRLFIGLAFHRDDVLAARNRRDERIVSERTKIERKPLQIVVAHRLIGKGENVMLKPRRADVGDRRVG